MGKKMAKLIFHTIILLFLVSCSQNTKIELPKEQFFRFDLSGDYNSVVLSNNSNKPLRFVFSLNEKFPFTSNNITNEINTISLEQNISDHIAAWKFVIDNTYSSTPLTNENWQHHPLFFLNSVGGGFCDDKASVLAQLWQDLGYQARIVNLGGHVVSEVYTENKWQMFDPDKKIFFCDSNSRIFSVKELETTFHYYSPEEILCQNIYFNQLLSGSLLSLQFAEFFTTASNNINESNWHIDELTEIESIFSLPSYSKLKIVFNGKSIHSLIVELTEKSEGLMNVPFVIKNIEGDFSYFSNTEKENLLTSDFILKNTFLPVVEIKKVVKPTKIIYHVNNKPIFLKNQNSINIKSDYAVKLSFEKTEDLSTVLEEAYLFFDTASHNTRHCGDKINLIHTKQNLKDSIIVEYNNFINCYTGIDGVSTANFEQFYQKQIEENGDYFEKLLYEKQPLSSFYLFLAAHYNKDYLNHLIVAEKLNE